MALQVIRCVYGRRLGQGQGLPKARMLSRTWIPGQMPRQDQARRHMHRHGRGNFKDLQQLFVAGDLCCLAGLLLLCLLDPLLLFPVGLEAGVPKFMDALLNQLIHHSRRGIVHFVELRAERAGLSFIRARGPQPRRLCLIADLLKETRASVAPTH